MKLKITILALSCFSLSYAQIPPDSPLNHPAVQKRLFNQASTTASNIMLANYFTNFIEMRTISDRTSKIRNDIVDTGFYARIYGGKLEPRSLKQFSNFSIDYYSGQFGYDTTIHQANGTHIIMGAELGYLYGDNHYKYANGDSQSFNASIYSTLFTDNHYYLEGFLKYSHIRNSYKFHDPLSKQLLKNNSKSNNQMMLSLETGKRWYLHKAHQGWYIEPQLQFTYSNIEKTHFKGPYNLELTSQQIKLPLLRAGLMAGYNFEHGNGFYNIYARFNYIRNFKSEIDFAFNNITTRYSIKKHWCDYNVGSNMTFNRQHSFVAEIGTANGNCFKEDLNLSLAYRYSF